MRTPSSRGPWIAGLSVLLASVVAHAAPARAMCGTPRWLGTAPAVSIPAEGVLYVASAAEAIPGLTLGDGATWRLEPAGGPGGLDVAALHYVADAPGSLTVGWGDWGDPQATLRVDAAWTAPAEPPRVVSLGRSQHQWMCSWQDAIAIQVDQPVAAFRVRWWTEAAGWSTAIIPPRARTSDGPSTPVLLLGKVDCAGETVPVAALQAGAIVDVAAIRFDGSEVAVTGVPPVLDLDDVAPFTEVTYVRPEDVAALVGARAAAAAVGPVIPHGLDGSGPRTGATALALLVGAALLGLLRGRALAGAMTLARLPVAVLRK